MTESNNLNTSIMVCNLEIDRTIKNRGLEFTYGKRRRDVYFLGDVTSA